MGVGHTTCPVRDSRGEVSVLLPNTSGSVIYRRDPGLGFSRSKISERKTEVGPIRIRESGVSEGSREGRT